MSPVRVPPTDVFSRTVNESDSSGASVAESGSITMKPVGTLTDPSVKSPVPTFVTVNTRVGPTCPVGTLPKSVWSAILGLVSPSLIETPLPETSTSACSAEPVMKLHTVPVVTATAFLASTFQ